MIRKFIIEKQGKATKNDVIKYMEKWSSRVPTLDMIKEFEDAGIIQVQKGDRRGQPHYLKIEEQNEYNLIHKEISEIEMIMLRMKDNLLIYRNIADRSKRTPRQLSDLFRFLHWYTDLIDLFLHTLLLRINTGIDSQKDSQTLYTKIIELMIINDNSEMGYKDRRFFDILVDEMKEIVNSQPVRNYAKTIGMKLSSMENFIVKSDDFRIKFLKIGDFKKQIDYMVSGNINNY